MLDLGVFSLWINPPLSLFTIVYHASVLVLSQRKRKAEEPSYFSTVTICAYILAIVWFVAFIVTVVVLASYKGDYRVESLQHRGLPVSVETQRLQIFLTLFEFIVVGGIGMKGHMIARSEGDPASWRPEEDYDNDKVRIQLLEWLGQVILTVLVVAASTHPDHELRKFVALIKSLLSCNIPYTRITFLLHSCALSLPT